MEHFTHLWTVHAAKKWVDDVTECLSQLISNVPEDPSCMDQQLFWGHTVGHMGDVKSVISGCTNRSQWVHSNEIRD